MPMEKNQKNSKKSTFLICYFVAFAEAQNMDRYTWNDVPGTVYLKSSFNCPGPSISEYQRSQSNCFLIISGAQSGPEDFGAS